MKVDTHVHLIGISSENGGYASPRMRRSIAFRYILRQMGIHRGASPVEQDRIYAERLAALVSSSELDRAVILALDEVYGIEGNHRPAQTHLHISNRYVAEVCRRFPEQFLFGASVHPARPDAIEELHRVKEEGAVLVKLLPNSHGFDPAFAGFKKYYRTASELQLPLLFHCGYEHTIPVLNQAFGDPRRLEMALDEGAVVIVAHAGSAGRFHRNETFGDFLRLLVRYPNCYGDTSALANFWRSAYLCQLLEPENLKRTHRVDLPAPLSRFVHGSDYPIPVSPWAFASKLGGSALLFSRGIANPLDVDVRLKRVLGVPDACLERFAKLIQKE